MSLLTTSAASIHQLGAAAALVGGPGKYGVAANTMLAGGWLIEQHTLRTQRHLDQETDNAVRLKDLAVIGSVLTNIGAIAAGRLVRGDLDAEGHLAADAS